MSVGTAHWRVDLRADAGGHTGRTAFAFGDVAVFGFGRTGFAKYGLACVYGAALGTAFTV